MEKVERENYERLSSSLEGLKNSILRELLGGIALDSLKHSNLYRGLLAVLEGYEPAITDEDFERLESLVETHIRVEETMMRRVEELLGSVRDERTRYILDYILVDEKRHHALLRALLKLVASRETITEDEWWDLAWRESPWHGSPGG